MISALSCCRASARASGSLFERYCINPVKLEGREKAPRRFSSSSLSTSSFGSRNSCASFFLYRRVYTQVTHLPFEKTCRTCIRNPDGQNRKSGIPSIVAPYSIHAESIVGMIEHSDPNQVCHEEREADIKEVDKADARWICGEVMHCAHVGRKQSARFQQGLHLNDEERLFRHRLLDQITQHKHHCNSVQNVQNSDIDDRVYYVQIDHVQ